MAGIPWELACHKCFRTDGLTHKEYLDRMVIDLKDSYMLVYERFVCTSCKGEWIGCLRWSPRQLAPRPNLALASRSDTKAAY